jgi:O-antigen/teichoic acid export membrane protein
MSFAQQFMTVIAGRVVAQVVIVATVPILTRIYSPEHLGVLSLLMGIASMARPLLTLRYEQALPQAVDEAEAGTLVGLALALAGGILLIGLPVAVVMGPWVAETYEAPELRWLVPALIPLLAGQVVGNLGNQWASFRQTFMPTAIHAGLSQIVRRALPVPLGLTILPNPYGLFVGALLAPWLGAIPLMRAFGRDIRQHLTFDRARLRVVAHTYRNFPIHLTGVSLLNMLSSAAPALVIGYFWSVREVGLFGQAYALFALPAGLFIEAAARAFYPRLAKDDRKGNAVPTLMRRFLMVLVDLTIYPMGVIAVIGPDFFAFVLGESFRASGEMARLIVPWTVMWVLFSPLSVIINVRQRQRALLKQTMVLTVLRVTVLVGFSALGDLHWAIMSFSLVIAAFMVGQLIWTLKIAEVELAPTLLRAGLRIGIALGLLAPGAAIRINGGALWLQIVVLALTSVVWAVVQVRTNPEFRTLLGSLLARFRSKRGS